MSSKALKPYLDMARQYIVSEDYESIAANEEHGPGTYCHLEIGDVPLLKFFGSVETEATAYFNPTDARGYSDAEGRRIAFERALKDAAKTLRAYASLAVEDLVAGNNATSYVAVELLRAMIALDHVGDHSHELRRRDRSAVENNASMARCEIADMAARFLAQKDANQRKLAKLRKMMNE
jgi:hypothetical protein